MKKNKMTVGLDVDGVIANFYKGICDKFGIEFKYVDTWNVDEVDRYFGEIKNDENFWETLPILNSSKYIDFDFDYYVTALPPKMMSARFRWILNNGFPNKPIIISDDKLTTCRKYGIDVLIDDKPSTLRELYDTEIIGIQYIPYYFDATIEGNYITSKISDIKNFLKHINNESKV